MYSSNENCSSPSRKFVKMLVRKLESRRVRDDVGMVEKTEQKLGGFLRGF